MRATAWLLGLLLGLPLSTAAANATYGPVPALPPRAVSAGALDNHEVPHAWAHLLVDHTTVAPGQTLRAAVLITLDDGWHVYWRNPGEAALPTQVEFGGNGVAGVGAIAWPLPEAFLAGGDILTFGYSHEVALSAPVTIATTARDEVILRATVSYLACNVQCVPGDAILERRLTVAAKPVLSPEEAARIDHHAATVPQPAANFDATVVVSFAPVTVVVGEPFALRVDVLCPVNAACAALAPQDAGVEQHLFWHAAGAATLRTKLIQPHPTTPGWRIEAAGVIEPYGKHPTQLVGVIKLAGPQGPVGLTFAAPFAAITTSSGAIGGTGQGKSTQPRANPIATANVATTAAPAAIPLPKLLLFALLGGVILNLMPCVFPVLALKVAAFTRLVHAERGHVLAHGAAYTGGIVASLLALAGLTVGLRSAGLAVGWGFQFQEPLFLAALATLLVLFALNLWDVFWIGIGSDSLAAAADREHGLKRSVLEGVLAVVLATPCSAPLLGTAMGFALMSNAATILAVFVAVGLGLALPFVLLTWLPGAARALPKPGPWMNTLKHMLSLALLATAAWLWWLTQQLAGNIAALRLGAFLLAAALVAWALGKAQRSARVPNSISTVVAAAVLLAGGAVFLERDTVARSAPNITGWQPYSDAALQEELAAGHPVFVDFTADWCITCKVNARTVLHRAEVEAMFSAAGVTRMLADWTTRDAEITAALSRLGRAGVPVYALYRPEAPSTPLLLPEVLTPGIIRKALAGLENPSP